MLTEIKLKIARAYKVPRVTSFIDMDIKLIKRINQIFQRFEKSEKEINILEVVNILKQLNNVFDLNELYPVLCIYIDIRFHSTLLLLFDKLDKFEKGDNMKLQELAVDEE